MDHQSANHQAGIVIAGRYRILGQLGTGASGVTYQASDLETHRRVALKELVADRGFDAELRDLVRAEATVLSQLRHPWIPKYVDCFALERDGRQRFYLAQELAPGCSLARRVESGWRAGETEVRRIATQVLGVLNYMHGLVPAVVHRDIKPQNLVQGPDDQLFLVDFGSVQSPFVETLTGRRSVAGTYAYMAPEQFYGCARPASDLYGLGTTLLHLLTRRSPRELPRRRLRIDFRARVALSSPLADWLERMTEPAIEDRFQSASESLDALRKADAGVETYPATSIFCTILTNFSRILNFRE